MDTPPEGHIDWEVLSQSSPHPGVRSRRLDSDALTIIRYELDAGAGYPRHTHPEEQFVQGVAGRATFTFGDQTVQIGSGDLVRVPPRTPHGATGGSDGVVFLSISPRRSQGSDEGGGGWT